MVLNETQKKRIETSFSSGNFNLDAEVEILVAQGFSQEDATQKVQAEVSAVRQRLFDRTVKKDDQKDIEKLAIFAIILIGMVGPVFDVTSLVWYAVAFILAGGVGYWAYKEKPIAGVIGCICFVVIVPFTYNWYISGRTSIIKIELLIPIGLALLGAYLIGLFISTILYSNKSK